MPHTGRRDPIPSILGEQTLLFEAAWEVCNQVGGIYTVIKTKAATMQQNFGENYCLLGPYNAEQAAVEFEEVPAPPVYEQALTELRRNGLAVVHGRWMISGQPRVILFDYQSRFNQLITDKYLLWKDNGIATPEGDVEMDRAVAFGFCLADFFKALTASIKDRPVLAQFHEWQAAVVLPRIRHLRLPMKTIFTTHATLLGRYMASDNPRFYQILDQINVEDMARHYSIFHRHSIERTAAQSATLFTTISEITAWEAERICGRKPDILLPNGLNVQRFTAMHEFQNLHNQYKNKIHEFVMGHFFPSYKFDLDQTLYLFVSGRYEYNNKGMDIFIESLYRLNQMLKQADSPMTVVAFIITQAEVYNVNVGTLHKRIMFDELKKMCSTIQEGAMERLLAAVAVGRMPDYDEFMPPEYQTRIKRTMLSMKSDTLPNIVTHDMVHHLSDPVLRHLRHRDLINREDDPVKVVFHPRFIKATIPLLGLDYDEFVRGCHLGVFPSYYEPWGYTPLECIALGVPTVTSDLSGFGTYVKENISDPGENGIYVLKRHNTANEQSIEALTRHLYDFAQLNRRERIEMRNDVERMADQFSWDHMIEFYKNAYQKALYN
ncbi:MAG: glycosyltransferase [Leptospiraceae bacterium]|nr:glycosyltransferase [Leptospiraceae bacterium]